MVDGGAFGDGAAMPSSVGQVSSGQPSFPSKAPELLALGALIVSLLLTSWVRRWIPISPTESTSLAIAIFGYVLTPFTVVGSLVWARADGIRRQADPWFDVLGLKSQLRRLQAAALGSFIIAFAHVTTIAQWATTRIGV